MKKYKTSLIYIAFLAVVSFFHFQLESLVLNLSAGKFILYLVYGLFLAFFLVVFIKFLMAGKTMEMATVLLIAGLIFFLLFLKSMFLFKVSILEFFILGLLVAVDNKKAKSVIPLVLLLGTACLIELVTSLPTGTRFYYYDVWVHSLTGLSGFVAGFLLF